MPEPQTPAMSHSRSYAIILTILLILIGVLSAPSSFHNRPNFLIILLDALRADGLGVYGNNRHTSPNIDSLKANSIFCERAFSQAPWTPASVASMFTGTYSTVHWVIQGNGAFIHPDMPGATAFSENTFGVLDSQMLTMPEAFKGMGYTTGVFSAHFWISPRLGYDQGVDHFVEVKSHQTDDLFQQTIGWLSSNRKEPFLIYMHVIDPHWPYEPPPPFDKMYWQAPPPEKFQRTANLTYSKKWEFLHYVLTAPGIDHATAEDVKYLRAMYDSEIAYVDSQIGTLLHKMKELGILDDTVVVIIGDHGESFFEHGYFEHGWHMYNTDFHIPMMFYNRKLFPKTVTISTPVQLIDLFPTLLDILNYPKPAQVQGHSILRASSRTSYSEGRYLNGYKIQSEDWSLITDRLVNPTELYYLKDDPGERQNKIAENPEAVSELLRALKKQRGENLHSKYRSQRPQTQLDQETIEGLKSLGYLN